MGLRSRNALGCDANVCIVWQRVAYTKQLEQLCKRLQVKIQRLYTIFSLLSSQLHKN